MSSAKAAERYIKRGLAPVPIPRGRKSPEIRGWQHLRLNVGDVPGYFHDSQNIGILLGEPSGDIVDVDLDAPEAAKIAGRFLAPTLTSGRDKAPHSHWWYRCPGAKTEKWKDLDGTMLVELRSTGCQTVVEPSVHPDGDRYRWHPGLELSEAATDELVGACRDVATAALIARHLPPVGGRHDFALALVGFLLRKLDNETVERIVHAAWDAAGDADREAHRDLDGIIRDTTEKLATGEHVVGGRALGEAAEGVPRLLARWWGWGGRGPVEEAPADTGPQRFERSDLGNAERLVAKYGPNIRYCHPWRRWLTWSGIRWAEDTAGRVRRMARETVRQIGGEAPALDDSGERKALLKWALTSEAKSKIDAMIGLSTPNKTAERSASK